VKILFVTSNDNALGLYDWLSKKEKVILYRDKLSEEFVRRISPEIIVSYNYRYIITRDIIWLLRGNIVNLHISLLPWNRGADPNIWSFIEDSPKGVTIHYIDEKIDHGEIIAQQEMFFDEQKETLRGTYEKLHCAVQKLFIQNWETIKKGRRQNLETKVFLEAGSFHRASDWMAIRDRLEFSYDDTIASFKEKLKQMHSELQNK